MVTLLWCVGILLAFLLGGLLGIVLTAASIVSCSVGGFLRKPMLIFGSRYYCVPELEYVNQYNFDHVYRGARKGFTPSVVAHDFTKKGIPDGQ